MDAHLPGLLPHFLTSAQNELRKFRRSGRRHNPPQVARKLFEGLLPQDGLGRQTPPMGGASPFRKLSPPFLAVLKGRQKEKPAIWRGALLFFRASSGGPWLLRDWLAKVWKVTLPGVNGATSDSLEAPGKLPPLCDPFKAMV